ncbi:MAG: ABC transporter ATP-binding protein/permease [Bifidobacteriaceae bacterium]|jgi:ATP-binding cassette subfamily B protein|nr:ABC transporter ATP-binding protein/permease [Bifidobacteriaceae bacterium]
MFTLFKRFLRPYAGQVVLLITFQIIQTCGTLFLPDLNADIINNGVVKGDQGYVWTYGSIMLAIAILQSVFQIGAIYLGTRTALKFGRDIRTALFTKVQNISEYEVAVFGAPSLITRETNDINQVQMMVMFLFTIIVSSPMMLIGGVFFALRQDVELSLVFVTVIPVLLIVIGIFFWIVMPLFKRMQKLIDRVNLILREQINGVRPIKAFVREATERSRFAATNSELTEVNYRVGRMIAFIMPFFFMIVNLTTAAILGFGGNMIDAGTMEIGALTAFITYTMFILMSVMMATMLLFIMPRASVSAKRILGVLNIGTTVVDAAAPIAAPEVVNRLEYRDVGFYYKGAQAPVLEKINFQASAGDVVAIVGATGSGKSTIIKMLPRLFDASMGEILINDIDIKRFPLADLRNLIGFVPQAAFLFAGTVGENLLFGKLEASDEECIEALKLVSALDFLDEKHPLDDLVDQGGDNFSGGQKQRLAMARALIRQPQILMLDDSYSALDANTERVIRDNLKANHRGIQIVVSQKISSVQNAQLILVLDHGTIVGSGTHEQLLADNSTYQEIFDSQKHLGADFDA